MFDRQRAVLSASGLGYLLCGVLLAVTVSRAWFLARTDPHRVPRDWDLWLTQQGQHTGLAVLGGLLLLGLVLAALLFTLAVSARARRLHPTSATLGGLLVLLALLGFVVVALWTGFVAPYTALQYGAAGDDARRQALVQTARLTEPVLLFASWWFLAWAAPGLYFLGRALRGERGWLPDALRLAAAFIVLHVPVTMYVARESLLHERYHAWLAVADQLLLWGSLSAACYLSARWLRALGRTLPG